MEADPRALRRPRLLRRIRRKGLAESDATHPKRGIYLFPNLITSVSLLLGFYGITQSFKGEFVSASWAIFAATFFDSLDGKIARLTKTTSAFGAQYDSLSDLVTFGVAPGIILYNFALAHSFRPRMGWMAAFIYVVCGALRLARYNIRPTSTKRFFEGLPIPAAANLAALSVIFTNHLGLVAADEIRSSLPNLYLLYTILLAGLMVSTLPYYGFKDVDLFRHHKFGTLVSLVIILVVVFQEPEVTLFLFLLAYAVSGPAVWFRRRKNPPPEPAAA